MSRRYNIRWSEADEAELSRVVNNFNAKIRRLEKKDPKNSAALPDKVNKAALKSLIQTRQDLNRELNALKRFSKRGAEEIVKAPDNEYNLTLTKWQRTEMNRMAALVNRKRQEMKEHLDEVEVYSRGEKQGYTRGQVGMNDIGVIELKPTKAFTPTMGRRDLAKKFAMLRKESRSLHWEWRNEIMRENYVREIERNFPPEMVQDIVNKIRSMPFDSFRRTFERENQHKFEFNYPLNTDEQEMYSEALRAIWLPKKKKKR